MATTHLSSLVSPIVNCSASTSPLPTSSSSCSKLNHHSSKPKQQQLLLKLTRRQTAIVIGFESLCVKFFDAIVSPQPASAAEEVCQFTVTDSGLAFCDKLVGYGAEPQKGQLIKAHYVGKLESGKVFDSSYNRGKPLTFRIGVGEVIKGWDQGILGGDGVPPMLAGGKRTLKLPPQLGYGMRGAGCKGGSCIIPPDSVLLFDVEFIGKA
uniref:peptidyl-prolyl cis-trans isomerase FKBP13, chloroplastic n=1 Tax=Erigeron canadensis TaxID=72917 RepID=UPI001CB89838|nr:peptidyl-prolyl cis-trans isomerase FKBP13, chloroplastic [Erigeron canadensis]